MRRLALPLALFLCVCASGSGPKTVYVKGYTRKDGTYVQPHYRSPPSSSALPTIPAVSPPAPLLPSPPRTEPRVSAPVASRVDPRVDGRYSLPAPTAVVVPVTVPSRPPLPAESPDEERERRAKYRLKIAKDFLDQGTPAARQKAVDVLEDLVSQYPGTQAAAEGQTLLDVYRRR